MTVLPNKAVARPQHYPWVAVRYRHLEGIGENIEIEFVDAPALPIPHRV